MTVEFLISEKAAGKIKEIRTKEKKENFGLRVRAAAGGCSGTQYQLGLDEKQVEGDIVIEAHGVKIFIDAETASLVNKASLDFVESEFGGGFKLDNPNEPKKTGGGCGCGSGGGGGHGGSSGGGCGSGCGCG